MKKKELKELRTKSQAEIKKLIKTAELELVKITMELRAGKLKDTQSLNKKRNDIARFKTILRSLQIGG